MNRLTSFVGVVLFLLVLTACAGQSPSLVVSYASTPAAVATAIPSTPTSTRRRRRPTRLPVTTDSPLPRASAITPAALSAAESPAVPALPAAPLDPATVADGPATVTDTPPSADQSVVTGATPSDAPVVDSSTPFPDGGASASPTGTRSAPSTFPGQVPADQGMFVTSSGSTSRYYYVRADKGWHRIHADRQVWFATVDSLLRVFPGRMLHIVRTPTPRPEPTPTSTPAG